MTNVQGESQRAGAKTEFDAVIIGAGFSGMYMLHSLRDKLDLNVTVFEAGDGVGGTWYWNRYPGARCDSDSYIYCYTFDKNLLQEWNCPSAIRSRMRSCAISSIAPNASTSSPTSNSASGSSRSYSTKAPSFGQCAPTRATW
jgi:monoamine oxidase